MLEIPSFREVGCLLSVAGDVTAAVEPLIDDVADLSPSERGLVPNAGPARLREFAAGRRAARRALACLGQAGVSILRDERGAPLWPEGVTGSISHTGEIAAAIVAPVSPALTSLGLDIEPYEPLAEDLWPTILTRREREALSDLPLPLRGLRALAVFCAKEATYKCQYPVTRAFLEFEYVEVDFDPGGEFIATISAPTWREPLRVRGQLGATSNVLAAVARTQLQRPLDAVVVPSDAK